MKITTKEVNYMREKLITTELENATQATYEDLLLRWFDAYSDEEIVELYDCTYGTEDAHLQNH